MNSHNPKKASSQVSWSLLMEGVTSARVDLHRLHILLDRAQALVDNSVAKEHLWQVAGDLILGIPAKLESVENSLDRTAYAMTKMGEEFLRGRLPLEDRLRVDEGVKSLPPTEKESIQARVARRFLHADYDGRPQTPSAEFHFFDGPKNREVREFAVSKAITNESGVASRAVKEMDNSKDTVKSAVKDAQNTPPTTDKILEKPGAKDFSTLNRYLVETEQPGNKGVPNGREDIPKHPILKTRSTAK